MAPGPTPSMNCIEGGVGSIWPGLINPIDVLPAALVQLLLLTEVNRSLRGTHSLWCLIQAYTWYLLFIFILDNVRGGIESYWLVKVIQLHTQDFYIHGIYIRVDTSWFIRLKVIWRGALFAYRFCFYTPQHVLNSNSVEHSPTTTVDGSIRKERLPPARALHDCIGNSLSG